MRVRSRFRGRARARVLFRSEREARYKSLKQKEKTLPAFGWFRLLLYPVHGQSHGQFARLVGCRITEIKMIVAMISRSL
jgi:hypothetical protein